MLFVCKWHNFVVGVPDAIDQSLDSAPWLVSIEISGAEAESMSFFQQSSLSIVKV